MKIFNQTFSLIRTNKQNKIPHVRLSYPKDTVSFGRLSDKENRDRFEKVTNLIYSSAPSSLTINNLDKTGIKNTYYQILKVENAEEKFNKAFPEGFAIYKDEKGKETKVTYGDLLKKWDKVRSHSKDKLYKKELIDRFTKIINLIYSSEPGSLTRKTLGEFSGVNLAYWFLVQHKPKEKFNEAFPHGYKYQDKDGNKTLVTYETLMKKWDEVRDHSSDKISDDELKNRFIKTIKVVYSVNKGSLTPKTLDDLTTRGSYEFLTQVNTRERFEKVFPEGYLYKDETGKEAIITYDDFKMHIAKAFDHKLSDEVIKDRFEKIINLIYSSEQGKLTARNLDSYLEFPDAYVFFRSSKKARERFEKAFPDGYDYQDNDGNKINVTYNDLIKKWDEVKRGHTYFN